MIKAYIGVGSNLDEPLVQVQRAWRALQKLPDSVAVTHSRWYRSTAIGPQQPDYVNGAALLRTDLEPVQLLELLQSIESAQGRVRGERWGPRTLDLDILLYGQQLIDEPGLQVPHSQLKQRNFVLRPLLDLDPQLILPGGETIASLLAICGEDNLKLLPDSEVKH